MDERKENYYSTTQVADLVGCDKSYISMLCRNDSIKYVKVTGRGRTGFKYMIPESSVEDLMLKREAEGGKVIMPKPITDSSKITVVEEDQKPESIWDEFDEFSKETTARMEALDKRLDTMQEAITVIVKQLGEIDKGQVDWMPTVKEYMEQYRQGYLEGYRNGFRDGDRSSSSVRFSKKEER